MGILIVAEQGVGGWRRAREYRDRGRLERGRETYRCGPISFCSWIRAWLAGGTCESTTAMRVREIGVPLRFRERRLVQQALAGRAVGHSNGVARF